MSTATPPRARRGPRPAGTGDARAEILAAARARFTDQGFNGTSMRAVARDAGVDASLIHYHFGSKMDLFVAAMELPYRPHELVDQVRSVPPEQLGEALTRAVLTAWDSPHDTAGIRGVVQSMLTGERAFEELRAYFTELVLGPLATSLDVPDADERVGLAMAHLVGVVFARHIIGLDAVAAMPVERVIAEVAPVVQRCLTRDSLQD